MPRQGNNNPFSREFWRDQWMDATEGGVRGWGWQQWADALTEPFVPGNFYNQNAGRPSTFLEMLGLGNMGSPPGFSPQPGMGIMPNGPGSPSSGIPFADFNPRFSWEQVLERMAAVNTGPEQRLYGDGHGMMRDPRNPFGVRPGTRFGSSGSGSSAGSTVVATGRDAQNMFEGMRNAQNDQSQAARQAMAMMFRGEER